MSSLEEEIGKLTIKEQVATQKFNELRELIIQIKQDIEVIREYQRHLNAHLINQQQIEQKRNQ
ncbi:MAG: riboflavin kinase [Candidatus Thiodiazotropha endolucinida]|nr:riboflavin kinase [Candidatus Thiodiazotropha endolucinida]